MRNTLLITLILFVLSLSASALAATRVPNFKLEGVDGKTYELKEVAGNNKLVLIDFWEVSCKPCKKLMPHLQNLYEIYKPAGFQLIVISRDTSLTMTKVKPYVATEKWTFPVLYDPDQVTSKAYQVKFSPVTFLINSKGEIIFQHSGFKPGDEKEYEKSIIAALELSEEDVAKLYSDAGKTKAAVTEESAGEATPAEETEADDEAGKAPPAEEATPPPAEGE